MPTLDDETTKRLAEKLAGSFGAEAARYDRTRPPYPDALVQRLVEATPGSRVVDVGCGTGTLSRQLQAAGLDVLGVEHDELMADFARATGVPVEVSKFEAWEATGREYDAVVAGQSWHWVDPEAGARKAAQVLRPGGLFVALWHVFSTPDPISAALADVFQKVAPDAPIRVGHTRTESIEFYRAGCAQTADVFVGTGEFSAPAQWNATWDHDYTTAEYCDLILTMSPMALLTPEQVTEVLNCAADAVDAAGGSFTSSYETLAVAITRN